MITSPVSAQIKLLSKDLRLPTIKDYENTLRECMSENGSYEDFLLMLLQTEHDSRKHNQHLRRIRAAKFPVRKTIDSFDIGRLEHVSPALVHELSTGKFIENKENIIMIGNPGTGKTHLSISIGLSACKAGYNVKFFTAANLAVFLSEAEAKHQLGKTFRALEKVDLLILDELSYLSFNKYQSELLFQVISERSERGSIILSTNCEFSAWDQFFPDTMLTTALIDRVTFRSHILNMNGASYRLNQSIG